MSNTPIVKDMHGNLIDLTGQVFNRWTVISRAENRNKSIVRWNCVCKCGNKGKVSGAELRSEHSKSCGCFKKENTSLLKSLRPYEATYRGLVSRGNAKCFLTYDDFVEFTRILKCHCCDDEIVWIKKYQSSYKLDRKDNNLPYTKDNCVVCCTRCNMTKSSRFTYAEWIEIGKVIKKLRTNKNARC